MRYNYIYIALIHGKWKPGVCDLVKPRFKGYNKGNFKFLPSVLYLVEEGHEEQVSIVEDKVLANLYNYLENPNVYINPTEYVNPEFSHIDDKYIEQLILKIIDDNHLKFCRVKEEYLIDSVSDSKFLEKNRMFPQIYLETI